MHTPEQVREKLAYHAARIGNIQLAKAETWAVIHEMENAWRTEPVKVRAANRRSCLAYLFGVPSGSTKMLKPCQIAALRKWMAFSADREAELRAVLTAALIEAGQQELEMEPDRRERDMTALFEDRE